MSSTAYLQSLDLPDSFEDVLQNNRLPLAYLPAHWLVLVCMDASRSEYAFTTGRSLHCHWESSHLHAFSESSLNFPPGALQVICPDNTRILAVKVTSMEAAKTARVPAQKEFPSRPGAQDGEVTTKPRLKIKL